MKLAVLALTVFALTAVPGIMNSAQPPSVLPPPCTGIPWGTCCVGSDLQKHGC